MKKLEKYKIALWKYQQFVMIKQSPPPLFYLGGGGGGGRRGGAGAGVFRS